MNRNALLALTAFTALTALLGSGCEKLKARDHLNKGVASFKGAKYQDAVDHFKEAVKLDPTYPTARLYLATAYMNQYIPGADSPENNQMGQAAEDTFKQVLEADPNNTLALASLASLKFSQAQGITDQDAKLRKLDEAKDWNQKLVAVDPKNKEANYSLGVIAWAKWYPALMTARAKLNMKPDEPGPLKDKKVREELKEKYGAMVDDGIASLQRAIDIDKEYDDAMAYMNLLIREKADLVDNSDEYKRMVESADNWVSKALETKKIKASRTPGMPSGGSQ
ncbi:MAG: tetratricopeptide repeat protein [Bryobacteraceae bacterium]